MSKNVNDIRKIYLEACLYSSMVLFEFYVFSLDEIYVRGP